MRPDERMRVRQLYVHFRRINYANNDSERITGFDGTKKNGFVYETPSRLLFPV